MPRGVDDIEPVVVPIAGRGGRSDRDAAFLFLFHPVHDRCAIMDFADLVALAGIIEDALGRRGLAGVNMGHDPEVAVIRNLVRARHEKS